jgi:superfamily II DNA or RNA helicase
MSEEWRAIFDAVRKKCAPDVWSSGVELSRGDSVSCEHADDDEAVFRIASRGGMISKSITLYLDDNDWDCECGSEVHGCVHSAAAVIVWRRRAEAGKTLDSPSESQPGKIFYQFSTEGVALALDRVVRREGESDHPIRASLVAMSQGNVPGPRFVATQVDLALESALGGQRYGKLPGHIAVRVLKLLRGIEGLELDGSPVHTEIDPITPRCVVSELDAGYLVKLVPDPLVTTRFSNGVVLREGALHPVGDPGLTGRDYAELPQGLFYDADRVADLVTEVLPRLRRLIPVDLQTERLPGTRRLKPRIQFESETVGHELHILALLVYGEPANARIDAGRLVHLSGDLPIRDRDTEKALLRRLASELRLSTGVRSVFIGEEAVQFQQRLQRWRGGDVEPATKEFALHDALRPSLSLGADDFDVVFESFDAAGNSSGGADPGAVLSAWRDGAQLVPLLNGGWAPIPTDWLEKFGDRVADLLAARRDNGELSQSAIPDLAALCEELDEPVPPEIDRLRPLVDGFERIPAAVLPEDLQADLRDYQKKGVDWLAFLRDSKLGALLADDMGLGKTLQALCVLGTNTLVVAPTSVLQNWRAEAKKFRPDLTVNLYHGPKRELTQVDLTLTTYALLRLDREQLAEHKWDTVVLDEAQAIKNPGSQVASAAFALNADFRLALTGTPVENRLEELWSQFHFINLGHLGGRADFAERYAQPIGDGDSEVAAKLRQRIRPFILRRLKKEVAPELPPRTEGVLRCQLDTEERAVYDSVRAATLSSVVKQLESGGGVMAALEALLRLRQASCHSGLVPGQQAESASKIRLLVETLENVVAEGHKALVFSQWTSLLDRCEPALAEINLGHIRLDGSTRDRGAVVEQFQDPEGPPVMLISLKAGGTGLNLTAADHVFLLDPWWNPAVEDQAADRAHRIGQDRPVMVYRLVAEETVEERILELQESKRELARAALDDGAVSKSITRDDLLELLR